MLETLGHYKILERIGDGSMGAVYRGRDTRLGRTVAVRVLGGELTGDADRRERLLHYARAATVLSHPNIAVLYEAGEDQDRAFLVYEFVPGDTLTAVMGGRPINPRRVVDLGVQLADALADGHAAGIVHGALHPGHVIVTPKGHAKILDFGTAMSSGADARSAAYLSPEQVRGDTIDHRTDIFSLGLLLLEMATGALAASGTTPGASAAARPRRGASLTTDVSPSRELDAIIRRATAPVADDRYDSAATVAADLREVAATLDARSTPDRMPVTPAAPSRRGLPLLWLIVGLVLAGAAAVWLIGT